MHCLYGGYNLHRFSDALGLVLIPLLKIVIICTLRRHRKANNKNTHCGACEQEIKSVRSDISLHFVYYLKLCC